MKFLRTMLAIKTVLASTDTVDTLIFDEVDTGISGSAAEKVGLKLREVSKSSQVLCVTHQAQIAALADYHYLIRKQVEKGRTFTNVTLLDHNGRAGELARIIGGVDITDAALKHAESMLKIVYNFRYCLILLHSSYSLLLSKSVIILFKH